MSIKKGIIQIKDEPIIEVSCEIEIDYDGNTSAASTMDELHSIRLGLEQPNEMVASECDESDSERHYIRFDDDEDQFYSSESDNVEEETSREEIDMVEEGMMLIFKDDEDTTAQNEDDMVLYKEVPLAVKEEIIDLHAEQSNIGMPTSCKVSRSTNACVQDHDFINSRSVCEPGGSRSSSKWHLGPNDRLATIESSDGIEPMLVVVRNVDSDEPICEPLKGPSSRPAKAKGKLVVKIHKLGKPKRKKTKRHIRSTSSVHPRDRAAKAVGAVPAPAATLFPRICLKDTMPLHCVLCNIECSNRRALIEHVKSHSTDKKSFECPTCNKTFTQQCNLKRHMRCHSGERPFSCPYCKKLFADQGYLTTHLRYHTNTKPYTCGHCDKSFFDRSNYVKHLKSHSGEKPYPCGVCNKSFLQQSDLTRHTRVHSGERPFKCCHCERSFTQHGDLTTHLRHHTGERPFVCSDCLKTFANKRYLNSHVKGRICLKKKASVGTISSKASKVAKMLSARALPVVTKRLTFKKELKSVLK